MVATAAVLRYLSRLAPVGAEQTTKAVTRRGDLAPLGWLDPRAMLGVGDDEPLTLDRTARLARLVSLDRLHSGEHLLRLGWLWLAGHDELAEKDFLVPIVSAPVSLQRTLRGYRMTLQGDAGLTPGLVAHRGVAEVLDDTISTALTVAGPQPPQQPILARYTQFKAWLRQVTEAVGVMSPDVVDPRSDPWEMREWLRLGMTMGLCVYLARDVDRGTVGSDLMNWAGLDTAGTALGALYGDGDGAEGADRGVEDGDVASAFPLNTAQRETVERSRSEPITVVSGPPGTGKSHIAAAIAVDQVARGNTVLLATQSDHAADVLADLLDRHDGPRYVRFGSREHRRAVADELAGGMAVPFSGTEVDAIEEAAATAADRVRSASSRIRRLLQREVDFTKGLLDRQRLAAVAGLVDLDDGIDLGRAADLHETASTASGLLAERRRDRAEAKLRGMLGADSAATLDDLTDAIELARAEGLVRAGMAGGGLALEADWAELLEAEVQWRRCMGSAIEAARRSREHRKRVSTQAVSGLAAALRSGRSKRRRILRDLDTEALLDVLPMWLGTLRDIDDTLPAEPAMFDVVILDEASQIDQMRAAPALARAGRAVVIGDPRQLRHVSFVADDAIAEAATEEGIPGTAATQLDVRRNSLFDAATAIAPVTELLEHFRSVPHIIGFSDHRFYDDRLRLMTVHPSNERRDAIRIVNVQGDVADEVPAVLAEVQRALDAGIDGIGVLSPFRTQAEAMEEALLEGFSDDALERGNVKVGTVHAFQGNEREVVIASLALGSRSFVEDPHLFNVMVTRARREIVIVTSADLTEGGGLLADYARWAAEPPDPSRSTPPSEGWIVDLAAAVDAYGIPVAANYPVAGYSVDLAVGAGADAFGVECEVFDGDPQRHIERYLALVRAGWQVRDAFRSRWLAAPEAAVAGLVEGILHDQSVPTNPIREEGQ